MWPPARRGPGRLPYGQVDPVPGPDGQRLPMELEFTEPQRFLRQAPEAAERFASALTTDGALRALNA
jgi:hypothetical protein